MSTSVISRKSVRISDRIGSAQLLIVASSLMIAFSMYLWATSLEGIDVRLMNDLGLISVLPPQVFVALLLLIVSYTLSLSQPRPNVPVLLLHIIVLLVILYGTTTLVEQAPRFQSTWKHVGVTEYITRTGEVDPRIDAYFNWPVFFILSAFGTEVAGLESSIDFVAWAPLFLNLIYIGGLVMVLSAATRDKRLIWLGVWLFFLTNWIGQDYFSPQGFNYFLFLVIVGILLRWFKTNTAEPGAEDEPGRLEKRVRSLGDSRVPRLIKRVYGWLTPVQAPNDRSEPAQRVALIAIVVVLFTVVASSHQLTPFFTLGAVIALVALNRVSLPGLPILLGIILMTWISYMAVTYMAGHFGHVTGNVGKVGASVSANVTSRLQGSPEHIFVLYMRLAMTGAIWGFAFLGGLRRLRRGHWDLSYALLAVAPFPVIALQSYGGEMALRVYLFALPFMAFFAAALFFTTPTTGTSWRTALAIGLVSIALMGGFLLSRYGNERMDYMTPEEETALRYIYELAEPRSLFVAATPNLPWKFEEYGEHRYAVATNEVLSGDVDALSILMHDLVKRKKYGGAYLILTRSQEAHAELFYGLQPGDWGRLLIKLTESGKFQTIFSNDAADIYALTENPGADSKGTGGGDSSKSGSSP